MLYPATMIIACPACATRYVVPDSAIGVDGRTVRCAKCRHSWFQDGPELAEAPATPAAAAQAVQATAAPVPAAPVPAPPPPPAEARPVVAPPPPAPPPSPISQPTLVEEPRPPRVYSDDDHRLSDFDDAPSSFDHSPPFRPRRNPLKLYTIAASVFALVAFAAIGAVAWYGLPDWAPLARQTFAEAQPDLVLEFPPNRQDRRTLPNGTEFFGASGKVTNVGKERRSLPPIRIILRDAHNRIVYSWDVIPPKRQLAPGESATINEAVTDVPRSAKVAEIGWKPG